MVKKLTPLKELYPEIYEYAMKWGPDKAGRVDPGSQQYPKQ